MKAKIRNEMIEGVSFFDSLSRKFEFLTPCYSKESFLTQLFERQEEEERSKNRQGHECH